VTTRQVSQSASLFELATKLVADLGRLVEQRLELLKAELTQEATCLARNLGMLAVGAVAAGVGLVFLLVALGLWVGQLLGSTPGGLAIVGGGLAGAGMGLSLLPVKNLKRSGSPGTRSELRRDAEWIRNGV
jgi:Putative Actinobacterial Holin-X, holin superfamily III